MRARLSTALGLALVCLAACASQEEQQVLPPEVLGMTETTAPSFDDGETQIFQVTKEVRLPMRAPERGERSDEDVAPYPRAPFVLARDTRITVRWTLSNLEDKQSVVELLFDPWNEFVRYQPGVNASGQEALPNFSGNQRFVILPPLGRVEGILTPDDMLEMATDLGTAMALDARPAPTEPGDELAGPALFNRAMNVQNRATVTPDPLLAPFIPAVVAGLTGFDVGLRSFTPVRVAVELLVDIEDLKGDAVVPYGEEDVDTVNRPGTVLRPPPPPAPP